MVGRNHLIEHPHRPTPLAYLVAKSFYILLSLIILFSILYAYKKRLDAEALYQLEKQSHEHEQELNNERLRFYTNITHELRTPLHADSRSIWKTC